MRPRFRSLLHKTVFVLRSRHAIILAMVLLPAVAVFLWVGLSPAKNAQGGIVLQSVGIIQPRPAQTDAVETCVLPDISFADFLELSPDTVNNYIRPELVVKTENVLNKRFRPPEGFHRVEYPEGSFAAWLQSLPLKAYGQPPLLYDGERKLSPTVASVLDMRIGKKDLQQCADTVMRLRAEYLYEKGEYSRISFHFVVGFECSWDKWRAGYRIAGPVETPRWVKKEEPSDSRETFDAYLDMVYTRSSTLSLGTLDMIPADPNDMQVGDAFVRPGAPGHTVIIADMAVNPVTQEKYIITAEGMIPAQQPQITNGLDLTTGPWILVPSPLTGNFASTNTSFAWSQLMRFKDIDKD